jgi:hypothetical protein
MTSLRGLCGGRMLFLLAVCLALPACGGNKNLTKANFDKIKPGMTLTEVEAILGQGDSEDGTSLAEGSSVAGAAGIGGDLSSVTSRSSSTKWVKWGDDKKYIRIGFMGDRVQQGMIQQAGLQ